MQQNVERNKKEESNIAEVKCYKWLPGWCLDIRGKYETGLILEEKRRMKTMVVLRKTWRREIS